MMLVSFSLSFSLYLLLVLAVLSSSSSSYGHGANAQDPDGATTFLNLTAITGRDNVSVLECWQLDTAFETSDVPGTAGTQTLQLGGVDNAIYTVLPPRFDGGLHNAPFKQYVWFISGVIHLSLPNITCDAWVYGGRYGLIYADDTADVSGWGHVTRYPGADETVAVSVPVEDGVGPRHTVLHDGPCEVEEMTGV